MAILIHCFNMHRREDILPVDIDDVPAAFFAINSSVAFYRLFQSHCPKR